MTWWAVSHSGVHLVLYIVGCKGLGPLLWRAAFESLFSPSSLLNSQPQSLIAVACWLCCCQGAFLVVISHDGTASLRGFCFGGGHSISLRLAGYICFYLPRSIGLWFGLLMVCLGS
jgi:hypothetical protein